MKKKNQTLLPGHVTVSQYAKLKNITRRTAYDAIEDGRIVPDKVGKEESAMIDWEKYKELVFRRNKSEPT